MTLNKIKMAKELFTKEQQQQIVAAVKEAELNTSGEIKVHIDNKCKEDVLDRAAFIFDKLEMQKTELRNGVLIYLAVADKKLAILGDAGINQKVADNFWDSTRDFMINKFKDGQFTEGLAGGIKLAGEQLKQHFPYQSDDVNELSDDISFGE